MSSPSGDDDELMQAQYNQSVSGSESSRLSMDTAKVTEQRLQSEQKASVITEQLKTLSFKLKSQESKCSELAQQLSSETQKYQYKFSALLMKNVINEMMHVQDRSSNAGMIKAFLMWRMETKRRNKDLRIEIIKRTFIFTLSRLVKTIKSRVKDSKSTALTSIRQHSLLHQFKSTLASSITEDEKSAKRKLQEVAAQLASMQQKHTELEAYIDELTQKERSYKDEIKHLTEEKKADSARVASLQTQTRRASRTRARDLAERVQDLEEENRDLRDKVDSMEMNVTSFLKEMSALLDHSSYQGGQGEEGHASEEDLRRPKRR